MRNTLKFLLCAMCCTMMFNNSGYSMDEISDEDFVKDINQMLHGDINDTVIILPDEIKRYEAVTGKKVISYDDEEINDNTSKNDINISSEQKK